MISILDQFDLRAKKQNFNRDAFETIADMKAFSENYLPPIFDAYCYEDGKKYRYNASNEILEDTGKWRPIGEGGGGDLSSYYTKTQTDTLLADKVDKVVGKGLSTNDFTDEEKAKLADLENYDDTALANRVTANENAITTLNGDSTVNGSVDKKVATCLSDSKSYTDTSIQNAIRQTAIVCDAKPTLNGNIITYYQGGVEKTITSDNKTKFYYTNSGVNYSTIWIEGTEFTDTVASVNFSGYVSKENDVISTYTGSEADKTKIPDIASLDALKALVDDDLDLKVNIADVESSVSSSSDNPVKSSALYTKFAEKVDIAQGIANEGKVLQVNDEGNLVLVDVSAMGTDASGVNYTNASYPTQNTVEKALNAIWNRLDYVPIAIDSLTVTPSATIYEIGTEISSLVFNWSLNKTPTTQTFNGTTVANDVTTFTYDTPFSTNKSFALNVSDGEKSAQKSINIQFQSQIFFGGASEPNDYDSAFILGLSSSKFNNSSYKGSYTITAGAGQYAYICCPKSWSIPSTCKIGGFSTELIKENSISFTNSSGGVVVYDIVRTTHTGLGSITMVFE